MVTVHIYDQKNMWKVVLKVYFEILALTYGPGPAAPGPFIIWKNIVSQICSRIIFEMHTAPGACSRYAPGAVYIQIMLLEHIWLRIFFQIIMLMVQDQMDHTVQKQLVLVSKSRPKSQKSILKSQMLCLIWWHGTWGLHIKIVGYFNYTYVYRPESWGLWKQFEPQ